MLCKKVKVIFSFILANLLSHSVLKIADSFFFRHTYPDRQTDTDIHRQTDEPDSEEKGTLVVSLTGCKREYLLTPNLSLDVRTFSMMSNRGRFNSSMGPGSPTARLTRKTTSGFINSSKKGT